MSKDTTPKSSKDNNFNSKANNLQRSLKDSKILKKEIEEVKPTIKHENLVIQNNNKFFIEKSKKISNTDSKNRKFNNPGYSDNSSNNTVSKKEFFYEQQPPRYDTHTSGINFTPYPLVFNSHYTTQYYYPSTLQPMNTYQHSFQNNFSANTWRRKVIPEPISRSTNIAASIPCQSSVRSSNPLSKNKDNTLLRVSIKLKCEEKILNLKRGDDYFTKAVDFCIKNRLKESLIKPIFEAIIQASESIDAVFLYNLENLEIKQLNDIKSTYDKSMCRISELDFSCLSCFTTTDGEEEELPSLNMSSRSVN